jgi:hypothetical protein
LCRQRLCPVLIAQVGCQCSPCYQAAYQCTASIPPPYLPFATLDVIITIFVVVVATSHTAVIIVGSSKTPVITMRATKPLQCWQRRLNIDGDNMIMTRATTPAQQQQGAYCGLRLALQLEWLLMSKHQS